MLFCIVCFLRESYPAEAWRVLATAVAQKWFILRFTAVVNFLGLDLKSKLSYIIYNIVSNLFDNNSFYIFFTVHCSCKLACTDSQIKRKLKGAGSHYWFTFFIGSHLFLLVHIWPLSGIIEPESIFAAMSLNIITCQNSFKHKKLKLKLIQTTNDHKPASECHHSPISSFVDNCHSDTSIRKYPKLL